MEPPGVWRKEDASAGTARTSHILCTEEGVGSSNFLLHARDAVAAFFFFNNFVFFFRRECVGAGMIVARGRNLYLAAEVRQGDS